MLRGVHQMAQAISSQVIEQLPEINSPGNVGETMPSMYH